MARDVAEGPSFRSLPRPDGRGYRLGALAVVMARRAWWLAALALAVLVGVLQPAAVTDPLRLTFAFSGDEHTLTVEDTYYWRPDPPLVHTGHARQPPKLTTAGRPADDSQATTRPQHPGRLP